MIQKLLIANRGEIACRIMRTAARLGIETVAVYSDADRHALHVSMADEALRIGPAEAADSYLRIEGILAAARDTGADAIHPGYGFLAENGDFAEACEEAGIVFVGPSEKAIRAMGSKTTARELMDKAGVPVVPGFAVTGSEEETITAAEAIGYPIMVKPALGGGGKGMRRIDAAADLIDACATARREAKSAFGDDALLLEKFIDRPRHIEVQIFGDALGNLVHLFDRDCSVQRRHQKVIEEAPAPDLSDDLRSEMREAAIRAGQAVQYSNAGTVEFILNQGSSETAFYFLEMNTRLQVEHPVTEMITGIDLVEWQLRVASGEPLPVSQDEILSQGHAIEARLYAEAPERNFLPSTGPLRRFEVPNTGSLVRFDTGFEAGNRISAHYDPMIAKLIVAGRDRNEALSRLESQIDLVRIDGVRTNLLFLDLIVRSDAFRDAAIDTQRMEREAGAFIPGAAAATPNAIALAGVADWLRRPDGEEGPWVATKGWRLNSAAAQSWTVKVGQEEMNVEVRVADAGLEVDLGDQIISVTDPILNLMGHLSATFDGKEISALLLVDGFHRAILVDGIAAHLEFVDTLKGHASTEVDAGALVSPMPGKILMIPVETGVSVDKGTVLLVVEAMKMEHALVAPASGQVTAFHYSEGSFVEEGAVLVDFEIDGESTN
jgi:3-methylcrotonyl-CoA carboxylase alpha subunit